MGLSSQATVTQEITIEFRGFGLCRDGEEKQVNFKVDGQLISAWAAEDSGGVNIGAAVFTTLSVAQNANGDCRVVYRHNYGSPLGSGVQIAYLTKPKTK